MLTAGLASALGCGGEASLFENRGDGGGGGSVAECVDPTDCGIITASCKESACIDGVCTAVPLPDQTPCDDYAFCTEGDACQSGECVPGPTKACPAPNSCQVGFCNEAAKACVGVAVEDGAPCNVADPCATQGVCNGGVCAGSDTKDCSFLNGPCTVGVCGADGNCTAVPANEGAVCPVGTPNPCVPNGLCEMGSCAPVEAPDGTACDDALFCTTGDACLAGVCVGGSPYVCAGLGECFVGVCDEVLNTCGYAPGNDGSSCDDGNVCTAGSVCSGGACLGGSPANDGGACDDGVSCTSATTCSSGICQGGMGPTVYFADTFADTSKGWTLGPEWEIGSAQASAGGVGGDDPDTDHTPTADNGVAGVVLGGLESTALHGMYYLESPNIDTSGAAGPVILSFFRWLTSDYTPYMTNEIAVYNGTQWVVLWVSGGPPQIIDTSWTYIEHDLTAYKNAAMRVRFGFSVDNAGVFPVGSWNIDDVLIASSGCP